MMRGILTFAVIVTALAATPFAAAMQDKPGQAQPAATAVNLNTATQADLEKLPGIGAATAKQIIEYRQKNNGFKKVEELMNIKGIGEKSFLKLKSLVTITPPKAGER
jgi:comEA protein